MLRLKIINNPKPLRLRTQVNFPNVILGKMQEKTVKPKTTFQEILPDKNYDGLSNVNVEAVTNEIDENIKSENIKKDVSILGVQGNIEELKGTKLEITKNGTYTPEEPYNAFTEVDVATDSVDEYYSSSYRYGGAIKSIKKIPLLPIDGDSGYNMFYGFEGLTEIPLLDTSEITNMSNMFYNCYSLQSFPLLDTSKVTTFSQMFYYCIKLINISEFNTDSATSFYYMFYRCQAVTSLHLLNASKVTNVSYMFTGCYGLTDLGGLQNLGQAYLTTASENYSNYKLILSDSSKLTHDSLMNVINNLYDIATKGVKTQKLLLGSTNLAKLTAEEVAIGTSKGWSIS